MGFPPNITPTGDPMTTTEKLIRLRMEVVTELSDIYQVEIDAYDFTRLAHWIYTGVDRDLTVFVEEDK